MMFKKLLTLAPHTDDGELGCGGSLKKWLEEGKEIYYIAFSSAEKAIPQGMPSDTLKKEVREAIGLLGISFNNLIMLDYPVRDFPLYRQSILDDMIKLRDKINPDLVLLPSTNDTHQDHQVISQEGFRAFKHISMIGYEMPWNNLSFNTGLFVSLEERHITSKMEALNCYKSQSGRDYMTDDFIRSLARTRGIQVGVKYAETYEVIRWVIR